MPVVQEVSKGFPFRLVNMPSFPCFAIALARPDDTIRNCLLPILPADQVIRLDFIINLVRNGWTFQDDMNLLISLSEYIKMTFFAMGC